MMGWTFHHYSNIIENYGSKLAPADTLDVRHFKKTLLAANDDLAFFSDQTKELNILKYRGEETIRYAWRRGLTLRDDSILVQPPPRQYFNAGMAQRFWPTRPVVLECEHYGGSRDRGNWGDGSW